MQSDVENTVNSVKIHKKLIRRVQLRRLGFTEIRTHTSLKTVYPLEIQNISEEVSESICAAPEWQIPDLAVTSLGYFW